MKKLKLAVIFGGMSTENEVNVIFPVLHGLYGEDGTIQGLFELIKKPYVDCKLLASCIGMDKVYSKIIFNKAKIKQTKYVYINKINKKSINLWIFYLFMV